MPNFSTLYNRPKSQPTITGDKLRNQHSKVFRGSTACVECCGQVNQYDEIQACLDGTKIENIIKRYVLGDTSALGIPDGGQYVDTVGMPHSYIEAQNMIRSVFNSYDNLPLDIQSKFDNKQDFINSVQNGSLFSKLSASAAESIPIIQEVNNNESEQ